MSRPGGDFVTWVTKRDLQAVIDIIPDSHRLCQRLERIVLACPNSRADGVSVFYHREEMGAIFLNAWPEDLWIDLNTACFEAHDQISCVPSARVRNLVFGFR